MKNKILLLLLISVIVTGMIVGPDYSMAYQIPNDEIKPLQDIPTYNFYQLSDEKMLPTPTSMMIDVTH